MARLTPWPSVVSEQLTFNAIVPSEANVGRLHGRSCVPVYCCVTLTLLSAGLLQYDLSILTLAKCPHL